MQFYLDGTTALFWNQITAQPSGVYNKENGQATSANINQLFVDFVDRPVGTEVRIFMNDVQVATAKVLNATGVVYSWFKIPYSNGYDTIDIKVTDMAFQVIHTESFATSHIDFLFEIQAKAAQTVWDNAEQLAQNNNVYSVEDAAVGGKFGVYTGLQRRYGQEMDDYREQTACLWRASKYSGTTKGLLDAIKCVVGQNTFVSFAPTRATIANRIFTKPRFVVNYPSPTDMFANNPPHPVTDNPALGADEDNPHYYIAAVAPKFRTAYAGPPTDPSPTYQIYTEGAPGVNPSFDTTTAQPFRFRTLRAINSEIVLTIGSTLYDATVEVTDESVRRQVAATTLIDTLANDFVASDVLVNGYTEGVDYDVDRLAGTIIWRPFQPRPADGVSYDVTYRYRLDRALQVVIKRIKPAFRIVVAVFEPVTVGLPLVVRA